MSENRQQLSNPVRELLEISKTLSRKMGHMALSSEHLALGLLQGEYGRQAMRFCNVDPDELYDAIYKRATEESIDIDRLAAAETHTYFDGSIKEVLNRAGNMARSARRNIVTLADIFLGLVTSTSRHWLRDMLYERNVNEQTLIDALDRLNRSEMRQPLPSDTASLPLSIGSIEDLLKLLHHRNTQGEAGVGPSGLIFSLRSPGAGAESDPTSLKSGKATSDEKKENTLKHPHLNEYAVLLNRQAGAGQIDPVIGREQEIERMAQVLARRRKNNPLLVGEPGVGKTALAEGLALRVVQGRVPQRLKNAQIYALSMGNLVAGTKYRGDFEERVKNILNEAQEDPNVILFVDEIHTVIGSGSSSGSLDAANLFKPALASGRLRMIGATTQKEYRELFMKERALDRRFQKVEVNEPSPELALQIMESAREQLELHHEVRFDQQAIQASVHLSVRYLPDRQLPDKAIDVLDEAGARAHLLGQSKVGLRDIEQVIAQIARVPVGEVSSDDLARLKTLGSDLQQAIFGQDEAIRHLVKAIKLSRAGIRQGNRPVANLMFAGPTGVGKTELARQLAQKLGLPLLNFDMSEYMEAHAVARLIGAPPGYVGHEGGGLLTEAIAQNPHAVLLLDEIEKANPSIAQIFLQVMDHGTLTDTHGRQLDCRNLILIMTTNTGAEALARRSIGFVAQDHRSDAAQHLRHQFPPEFRNRLDALVQFSSLEPTQIRKVVQKMIDELGALVRERGIELTVTESGLAWLAQEGFDEAMGARPMRRLIEQQVHEPLADAMLFGALDAGGTACFDVGENGLEGVFSDSRALVEA